MGLCYQKSCVGTVSKCLWDITINVLVISVERLEKGWLVVVVLAVLSKYLILPRCENILTVHFTS